MTDPTYRNPPTVDDYIIDAITAIAFIGTGECWVMSWWEELGVDIISDRPWPAPVAAFRLPVAVEGADEPVLVPVEKKR